ncbi:MAG TPA: hypothetical protein VG675_03490 [Bryobacteraceae bacterium]|nr:hypothetical protein [Bryobacteraceae bacterium]
MDILFDLVTSVPREHLRPHPSATFQVEGHRLSEQAISEMLRRSHVRQTPFLLLSLTGGFLIAWLGGAPRWLACIVYGALTYLTAPPLRGIGTFKENWRTFELLLDEDRIEQRHAGRILTLHRSEITAFVERRGFGMTVKTADPDRAIWIPSVVNGYEDLRLRLSTWMQIQPWDRPTPELKPLLDSRAGFQCFLAVFLAAMMARSVTVVVTVMAFSIAYLTILGTNLFRSQRAPRVAWLALLTLVVVLVLKLAVVLW